MRRAPLSRRPVHHPVWGLRLIAASVALALGSCAELAPPATQEAVVAGPHEPLQIRRGKVFTGFGRQAEPLTDVSSYCADCHAEDLSKTEEHGGGAMMSSHPVDLEYASGPGDFVPRSELDERLVLIDGKMTCATCHDLQTPDHRLVMANDQSQICRACHRR